jgi:hypothetical protein
MFPIIDESLKRRLLDEVLALMREDNVKSWQLGQSGAYKRVPGGDPPLRSQSRFMALAKERAKGPERFLNLGSGKRRSPLTPASGFQKLADIRRKRKRGTKRKK